MSAATQSFSTGDKVVWRSQTHTVDAVFSDGGRVKVLLRSDTGSGVFDYSALLLEGVTACGKDGTPVPQPAVTVNHMTDEMVRRLVPDDEYRRMVTLREHIREYDTGYRSGDPKRALPHEPKPQYDPSKVRRLAEREKNKSKELESLGWDGVGHKNLERLRWASPLIVEGSVMQLGRSR